jgi:phosphoserine phosphatase
VTLAISQMRAAMLIAVTLVSPDVAASEDGARRIDAAMAKLGAPVKRTTALGPGAIDLIVEADTPPDIHLAARSALGEALVDLCVQPWEGRRKRLLVADMDSTIIGCECLDELADFAGVKAEVSAITERAMRGEIGFEGALRERVAMLRGLPVGVLEQCYVERVRLNPGARTLAATMAAHGARCVLVSGGFSFFTARVAEAAGFHAERANTLIVDGAGALTGWVGEPILGREAKLAALIEEAARLGVSPDEAIAIGDGANDLAMINAAGLGVAYRAKPLVAAEADARIDHGDLTAALYFQGYQSDQFSR